MSINYVDLLVIVVIALSVFLGYKKGFLKTITGFLAIVISLILAMTFQESVSNALKNTFIYDTVYETCQSVIDEPASQPDSVTDFGTKKLNLPKSYTKDMQKNIDTSMQNAKNQIAETVAVSAMKIIALFIIFAFSRILIFVIMLIFSFVKKLPLIGFGDGLLGALFGVFRGMLIVYIIFAAITLVASFSPDNFWAVAINHSKFAKLMYNDNVLLDFIFKT